MTPTQHRAARALFERVWRANQAALGLPDPTPHALQLLAAVSARETQYASPAAWAKNVPAMASSNNYGAITCAGPASETCIPGVRDNTQAGSPTVGFFRAYATAEDGVLDLIRHLTRSKTKPALLGGTARDLAEAMYSEGYYTGICFDALKTYPRPTAPTSTGRAYEPGSLGGAACDAEVTSNYARGLRNYIEEIAAALGEEPVPLESATQAIGGWPVVVGLGLAAVGFAAWWFLYREPADRELPVLPLRRNAGRSEWRALYRTTCGDERDARRLDAKDKAAARRGVVAELVTRDRKTASAARRASKREATKAEHATERAAARKAALAIELDELRAAADQPCDDAKAELVARTRRERADASERRTPAQRKASRRTLEKLAEEIEREAGEVEHVIERDFPGMGAIAKREFLRRARHYVREARRSHGTSPAELAIEDFAENEGNMRALVEETEADEEDAEEYAERAAAEERAARRRAG